MSFIKNIEIWNNHRPRVCNFDIEEYCLIGAAGNTCTENTNIPENEDLYGTARATYDAWLAAVDNYFLASYNFYYDPGYQDPITGDIIIPEGLLNEKCNSLSNLTTMCSLYYGQPDGFVIKSINFRSKREQIQNSLLPPGDPNKKTGIETNTISIPVGPNVPAQPYTYSIDFTNYQTPEYSHYLEYRTSLGDMMQQLKKIMTATGNHPLTPFDIP